MAKFQTHAKEPSNQPDPSLAKGFAGNIMNFREANTLSDNLDKGRASQIGRTLEHRAGAITSASNERSVQSGRILQACYKKKPLHRQQGGREGGSGRSFHEQRRYLLKFWEKKETFAICILHLVLLGWLNNVKMGGTCSTHEKQVAREETTWKEIPKPIFFRCAVKLWIGLDCINTELNLVSRNSWECHSWLR